MNSRLNPPEKAVACPRFKYTGNHDLLVLYRIIDGDSSIEVICADGMGSYEWVIKEKGRVTNHSDHGYGMPTVALRDGLMEYDPPPRLSFEQLNGTACVVCGASSGPMVPLDVETPYSSQVFHCERSGCTLSKDVVQTMMKLNG